MRLGRWRVGGSLRLDMEGALWRLAGLGHDYTGHFELCKRTSDDADRISEEEFDLLGCLLSATAGRDPTERLEGIVLKHVDAAVVGSEVINLLPPDGSP